MANTDKKKKLNEKIQKKEHLTNVFLVQFVVALVFSVLFWVHLGLWSANPTLAYNVTRWTPWVSISLALVLAFLPYVWKTLPTGGWWRTFCYSLAFFGLFYCILNLHIALGQLTANIAWLSFAKFGNEYSGIKLLFGWVWLGFLVCFIRYMVQYNRVSKNK